MILAAVSPAAAYSYQLEDRSMSALGGDLRERIEEARLALVSHRVDEISSRLATALLSAHEDGTLISREAWTQAVDLLKALLSYDAPLPEVIVESDGTVGLDWDKGTHQVVSLTVRDTPMVGFSALFGAEPLYGRMVFSGEVPSTLRFLLARLFPRDPVVRTPRRVGAR